jgi:hypothetical protein
MATAGAVKDIPEGAIHHWFGAIFVPNTSLDRVIAFVQDYSNYGKHFEDVKESSGSRKGNEFDVYLRITRSNFSRSRKILQIKDAGTPAESLYPEGNDKGYLWRLNSYWRFIERDEGVVVECESVGLSRSLSTGERILSLLMANIPKRAADAVPQEALQSLLTGLRNGVAKQTAAK